MPSRIAKPSHTGAPTGLANTDNFSKMAAALRRWIFFWQGKPRAPEAEESLATLLNKRGEVRSTRTAAGETRAELFQPQQQGRTVDLSGAPAEESAPQETGVPDAEAKPAAEKPPTTTSWLLEAKKRAQRRKDG